MLTSDPGGASLETRPGITVFARTVFAPAPVGGSGGDKEDPEGDVGLKSKFRPQRRREGRGDRTETRPRGPRAGRGAAGTPGTAAARGGRPRIRRPAAGTDRRPHLDGVEFARQHRLQVEEQGDGDVGEEVEPQQPLQTAPSARGPHHPLVGPRRSGGCARRQDRRRGKRAEPAPSRDPRPAARPAPPEGYAGRCHWLLSRSARLLARLNVACRDVRQGRGSWPPRGGWTEGRAGWGGRAPTAWPAGLSGRCPLWSPVAR